MKSRLDVEIDCLRAMLSATALRKFPWCGASAYVVRAECAEVAKRLRAKFLERERARG